MSTSLIHNVRCTNLIAKRVNAGLTPDHFRVAGGWYRPGFRSNGQNTNNTGGLTANRACLIPFNSAKGGTVSQMAVRVAVASASTNNSFVIYAANGVNGFAGQFLAQSATFSSGSSGTTVAAAFATPFTFAPGLIYWVGFITGASWSAGTSGTVGAFTPSYGVDAGFTSRTWVKYTTVGFNPTADFTATAPQTQSSDQPLMAMLFSAVNS